MRPCTTENTTQVDPSRSRRVLLEVPPVSAGKLRKQSLTELYRHSPLFVALRDSSNLKFCGG
jgi:hypothetical protein